MEILTLIIICIIIVALLVAQYDSGWIKGKTLDDFKEQYPESFKNGQFSSCPYCNEKSIWVKTVDDKKQSHGCRICGKELWRSKA